MPCLIGFIIVMTLGSAAFLAYTAHQKKSAALNAGRRQLDLAIAQLSLEVRHHPKNAAAFCKRGIILLMNWPPFGQFILIHQPRIPSRG